MSHSRNDGTWSMQCGSCVGQHKDIRSWNGRKVQCCLSCGTIIAQASYLYMPLNLAGQFRLLELLPGGRDADLFGELLHFKIDECPSYEAVSYTWGDQHGVVEHSGKLHIRSSGKLLNITTNCDAALRRIRDSHLTRLIWVDSICIDQENLLERSEQVELMTRIYSGAKRVLAYLGAPPDDKLHECKELFDYIETKNADQGLGNGESIARKKAMSNILQPKSTTEKRLLRVLLQFFAYPWFHRIWIVQEVIMAQSITILFGELVLDWKELLMEHLETPSSKKQAFNFECSGSASIHFSSELEYRIPPVLRIRRDAKNKRYGLIDLLFATQRCVAGDPRDKVYALFGMARIDESYPLPKINYDHSVQSIFEETTVYCIEDSKSFEILYLCNRQEPHSTSWIPNFANISPGVRLPPKVETMPHINWIRDMPEIFQALCGDHVHIQGVGLDTILGVQDSVEVIARVRAAQPKSLSGFVVLLKDLFPDLYLHPFFVHDTVHPDLSFRSIDVKIEPRESCYLDTVTQWVDCRTNPEDMEAIDLLAPLDRDPRGPFVARKTSKRYYETLDLLAPLLTYTELAPRVKRRKIYSDSDGLPATHFPWLPDSLSSTTCHDTSSHPVFKRPPYLEDVLFPEDDFFETLDVQRTKPTVEPTRKDFNHNIVSDTQCPTSNDLKNSESQRSKIPSPDVEFSQENCNVDVNSVDWISGLQHHDFYNLNIAQDARPPRQHLSWCIYRIQLFFHWIRLYAEGRAVYYGTKTVGIVPSGTQKNDAICVLDTMSRSVVLEREFTNSRWETKGIRGPCTSLPRLNTYSTHPVCKCGLNFRWTECFTKYDLSDWNISFRIGSNRGPIEDEDSRG